MLMCGLYDERLVDRTTPVGSWNPAYLGSHLTEAPPAIGGSICKHLNDVVAQAESGKLLSGVVVDVRRYPTELAGDYAVVVALDADHRPANFILRMIEGGGPLSANVSETPDLPVITGGR